MSQTATVSVYHDQTVRIPNVSADQARTLVAAWLSGQITPGPDWTITDLPVCIGPVRVDLSPNEISGDAS